MELWSAEWKQQELGRLFEEWKDCQRCQLCNGRQNVVFGSGNPDADLMFIGEGPGKNEDKEGVPFIGDGGQLLQSLCATIGISWEELYISNIVACRPPENRDPLAIEKDACLPRLHQIIYIVDPLLIVAVGKYAMNALVAGRSWGIEKEHGNLFSSPSPTVRVGGEHNGVEIPGRVFPRKGADKKVYTLEYDMVPIFHPAYILRVDSYDRDKDSFVEGGQAHQTLDDLQAVVDRIEQLRSEYEVIPQQLERR
jgi:uracil-DNA glycosylase family 4